MKRFIYYTDKPPISGPRMELALMIAPIIGNAAMTPKRVTTAAEKEKGNERFQLDRAGTWFLITYSGFTFEIVRDKKNGIKGLEELQVWLSFFKKGVIFPVSS